MKKALWIVLDLIFLAIFNVIFFVLGGTEHLASVWMSYAFIHFSYFMMLLTPLLLRKDENSTVLGFSLYSISAAYFFIELIVGTAFVLAASESYKLALVVQLIIVGLYGALLVSHMIANEHTSETVEDRNSHIAYVKNASSKLKLLLGIISDGEAKKKVESVYDVVNSSPVKSHPNLFQTECKILQSISELGNAVSDGRKDTIITLADSLLVMANERNTQLKTLN
jgi:hypothetical protein